MHQNAKGNTMANHKAQPAPQRTGRQVAVAAFTSWVAGHAHYGKQWTACSKEGKQVAQAAILGMRTLTPFAWNHWWALGHMRYTKVTGREQRLVNEILTVWLGDIASGRAKIINPQPAKA
jgi:hypothetical protein